jgi:hypothetical protein
VRLYKKVQTPVFTTFRILFVRIRGSVRHIHFQKCAVNRDAICLTKIRLEQSPIEDPTLLIWT